MKEDEEREEWMNAPMGKIKSKRPSTIEEMNDRIIFLEEELDKLTEIVRIMSDKLIELSELCPNKTENVQKNREFDYCPVTGLVKGYL